MRIPGWLPRVHLWKPTSPSAQLAVIGLKGLLVCTVVALVAASYGERRAQHHTDLRVESQAIVQHEICVGTNAAFTAVDQVIQHGIDVTRERLVADVKAGRKAAAQIDRKSLASSALLLAKIAPIDC